MLTFAGGSVSVFADEDDTAIFVAAGGGGAAFQSLGGDAGAPETADGPATPYMQPTTWF